MFSDNLRTSAEMFYEKSLFDDLFPASSQRVQKNFYKFNVNFFKISIERPKKVPEMTAAARRTSSKRHLRRRVLLVFLDSKIQRKAG